MRVVAIRIGTCLAGFLLATQWGFTEVTDLRLSKSGTDVVLSWTTGLSSFRALRSETAVFMSGNARVAEGLTTGPATDTGALLSPRLFFYQVLGSDDPDPPLYDLNPPRAVPTITMLTPNGGQAGTSVTIDGSNFSAGGGMVVMFGDLPATVPSATPTQILTTAPTGVLTSDVVVCVAEVCSNKVRFNVTVGPTFQDVSSLAFEPGTGSLWIGDRGTADQVIEIDSAGTVHTRTPVGPFESKLTAGDAAAGDVFGSSVSIAGDTTIAGAPLR